MARILIFGGTSEGREEAMRLMRRGETVLTSVTSVYARELLPAEMPCRVGVLDAEAMAALMAEYRPDEVVDATHPFAVRATENIFACAQAASIPYRRVERPTSEATWKDAVEWVDGAQEAAKALRRTEGAILLTTGSHTLSVFTEEISPERLYVRVLPTMDALEKCRAASIFSDHVMAMQGPFSASINAAVYDQWKIRTMVTKDSGKVGGVDEKVLPALARDIHVIVIARPKGAMVCAENR